MLCCLHTFCSGLHGIRHSCTVGRSPSLEGLNLSTYCGAESAGGPTGCGSALPALLWLCVERGWVQVCTAGGQCSEPPQRGGEPPGPWCPGGQVHAGLFADVQRHVFNHLALPAAWPNPCQAPNAMNCMWCMGRKALFLLKPWGQLSWRALQGVLPLSEGGRRRLGVTSHCSSTPQNHLHHSSLEAPRAHV